jgi:hypothetical protein
MLKLVKKTSNFDNKQEVSSPTGKQKFMPKRSQTL